MQTDETKALREIGRHLDACSFGTLQVHRGGIVVPSGSTLIPQFLGTENRNERKRSRRSPAGARPWTFGRPRPSGGAWASSGGSWATCPATSVVGRAHGALYAEALDEIEQAYPGTRDWHQQDALWLIVPAALLPGGLLRAKFVARIPNDEDLVRAWGFWDGGAVGASWIGPRHTNFPDGTICAFERQDGTWNLGDPLLDLFDLYTVWGIRHLHLRCFGRWPGPQAVADPYERILEFNDDELCGCGAVNARYSECCRDRDQRCLGVSLAMGYTGRMMGGLRHPPAVVTQFIREQRQPPTSSELFAAQAGPKSSVPSIERADADAMP